MKDYYDGDFSCIHLKFGDMRKHYNFTKQFTDKHPLFVEEYAKYFECKPSLFIDPLQIINYVDMYSLKVEFYFNMNDTPAKDFDDVRTYLNREHIVNVSEYKEEHYIKDAYKFTGIDGEERAK